MKKSGFSLLELSIVLVIIGLIAGGVVAGQAMIHAAELRSVVTDISQYQTALNTFRDKYLGKPGDLRNAEDFWGTDVSGCPSGGGAGTCNGDSNGAYDAAGEDMRAWQQLALAELVEGSFTGVASATTTGLEYDVNIPSASVGGGYWLVNTTSPHYGKRGNLLELGAFNSTAPAVLNNSVLNSIDAAYLDSKIDDGQADSGNVYGLDGGDATARTCTTGIASETSSSYILTNEDVACRLFFWLD